MMQPEVEGSKKLSDLPEELIREIMLRLSDYRDLENSGGAFPLAKALLDEQHIWRELCRYHFTRQQVKMGCEHCTCQDGKTDYEQVFQLLRRKFGLKEEYADTLVLCRYCRCLFWKGFGHPCVNHDDQETSPSTSPTESNINTGHEASPSPPPQHNNPGHPPSPGGVPLHIPVPPQAFLKFFSL